MAHHEVACSGRGRLRRGLRPIALFAMMFLISSGAPYGLEEMVPTAGPGLAGSSLPSAAIPARSRWSCRLSCAFALGGSWLALLTALGTQCSSAGLFHSELLVTSRLPYALAKDCSRPRRSRSRPPAS